MKVLVHESVDCDEFHRPASSSSNSSWNFSWFSSRKAPIHSIISKFRWIISSQLLEIWSAVNGNANEISNTNSKIDMWGDIQILSSEYEKTFGLVHRHIPGTTLTRQILIAGSGGRWPRYGTFCQSFWLALRVSSRSKPLRFTLFIVVFWYY